MELNLFTGIRNISKALSGVNITMDLASGKINRVKYRETNFKIDRYHKEEYFIVRLVEIPDQKITHQLRRDVPLGSYLNGVLTLHL